MPRRDAAAERPAGPRTRSRSTSPRSRRRRCVAAAASTSSRTRRRTCSTSTSTPIRRSAPVASNKNIQTAIRYALDYPAFVKLSGPGAVQAPGMIPTTFIGHLPPVRADQARTSRRRAPRWRQSGIDRPEDHDDLSVRAHDQRHLVRDARAEDEGEPRRGRDRGDARRQAGQRVPGDVRRGQARDEPVATGARTIRTRTTTSSSRPAASPPTASTGEPPTIPQLAALAKKAQRTVSDTQRGGAVPRRSAGS